MKKKHLYIASAIVAVGAIVYFIAKMSKRKKDEEEAVDEAIVKEMKKPITVPKQPKLSTKNKEDAAKLYSAMKSGDQSGAIKTLVGIRDKLEFGRVFQAFGTREWDKKRGNLGNMMSDKLTGTYKIAAYTHLKRIKVY